MKSTKRNFFGLLITFLLSGIVIIIFYGELLKSPNNKYFASGGDGLKSYYVGTYHIKYDSTYTHSQSMNYPYGESVFFTDCHPLISNSLKFISRNIFDVSDYFVGTINILMLISLLIATLFLYMIFIELGLPYLFCIVPSIAIVFLSPQVDRMGGHFSFSYHFVLPAILYLLFRFYRNQTYLISFLIAFLLFFGLNSHQYLFIFCSVFLFSIWILFIVQRRLSFWTGFLHFSIQFLLPFISYALLLTLSTNISDRTSHPWGIMYYRAYPESVFLPFGKPYGRFLYNIFTPLNYIDWEGYAYIGLLAVIGFLFLLKRSFFQLFKGKFSDLLKVTENPLLNYFFWASFLALLYSFGIPYIYNMEYILDYIGVLRQLRGIARFAWLFYYLMNILVFYWLWKWSQKEKSLILKSIVLGIAFTAIVYDAWLFNKGRQYMYNNEIPMLSKDFKQDWLNNFEIEKYQAIIPIPYFNVGSENLWIDPQHCNSMVSTFIVSQKTGLPTNGVMLSRTSISQCYKNIQLTQEPYRIPEVLKDCKDTRPFLIVTSRCREYSDIEKSILRKSVLIDSTEMFSLYEIQYNQLLHASDSLYEMAENELYHLTLFKHDEFLSSNETLDFVYRNFDNLKSAIAYHSIGAYTGELNSWNTIFEGAIPNCNPEEEYVVSFWYGNALTDVQLRSNLILAYFDEKGNPLNEEWFGLQSTVKILDNDWALCELRFKMKDPNCKIKIVLRNQQIRKGTLLVDNLLIRPLGTFVFQTTGNGIIRNNRVYFRGNQE